MRPQLLLALLALAAAPLPAAMPPAVGETPLPTLAPMIKKVSPAVVNIATRGTIRERGPQNPLLDDPFFRRFFDVPPDTDRKSTRLNSSHLVISYAVFCLKKKNAEASRRPLPPIPQSPV